MTVHKESSNNKAQMKWSERPFSALAAAVAAVVTAAAAAMAVAAATKTWNSFILDDLVPLLVSFRN